MNTIITIAGKDTAGYSGDVGPAINAKLYGPYRLCLDKYGNIIITDSYNNRVRKITKSTGIITTIAGTGAAAYSGDNGPAISAELNTPDAIVIDTGGNIFIADGLNYRVRKINSSTGIITTIAGTGIAGNLGDGGLAVNAQLRAPSGLCFDKMGNYYIADPMNYKVRKVDAITGIITTIAGNGTNGYSGDNGPATNAQIGTTGIYADTMNNIYLADQFNNSVRKVDVITGIITTIAGTGIAGYSGDNGLATSAKLNAPTGIYVDKQQNIFIADYGNGSIRKINAVTKIITTVAGIGTQGYSGDHGPATSAQLRCSDVVLDSSGTMYIADYENNVIRKVYNRDPVGIALGAEGRSSVQIYPNPVRNELTVAGAGGSELRMYDVVGREAVLTMTGSTKLTLTGDKETINIGKLQKGIYIVQIIDPSTGLRITKKIVKE